MSSSAVLAKRIGLTATVATVVGTLAAASVTPVAAQADPEPAPPTGEGGQEVATGFDSACEDMGGDEVCTSGLMELDGDSGFHVRVRGYSYPANTDILVQANIYQNSYKNLFFRDTKPCDGASTGTCTYDNWFQCSPGIYLLSGWSWKSGSNVQPAVNTSVRV